MSQDDILKYNEDYIRRLARYVKRLHNNDSEM